MTTLSILVRANRTALDFLI